MKKSLLLSFCVLTGISFGQSFTVANEYQIGAAQKMYLIDSAAPSYATTVGTGVNWNYSSFGIMPNGVRLDTIYANSNTTDYPIANKVNSIQNVLTTYLETNASGRSIAGIEYITGNPLLGTIKMIFNNDKLSIMDYDFALNNTKTDIFDGHVISTLGDNPATGTSFSKFDAIGTLVLGPTVTKTNISRHHLTDTINTSVNFLGQIQLIKIVINQFDYYEFVGNNMPVFSHVNVKIFQNGNLSSSLNFVLNSVEPLNSAGLNSTISKNSFSIYPNPANEEITISGDLTGNEKISITDLSGKEVIFTFSENKINISKLNAGVYFLNIEKDGQVSQEKFVKK